MSLTPQDDESSDGVERRERPEQIILPPVASWGDGAPGDGAPGNGSIPADPALLRGLRAAMSAQRPAVLAHIRSIRRQHPAASPEQVVRILEKRYLTSVTLSGAGSGGASVIPGVGTAISLTVIGAETVLFFEMTALFAQSVTEIHGIAVDDEERAHNLVMALLLGGPSKGVIEQFLRQASNRDGNRVEYWGETITATMPKALTSYFNKMLREQLAKRFAVAQGAGMAGRLIPFGIGAVIGGTSNRIIGGKVVTGARAAFGPAPLAWPAELEGVSPRPVRRLRLPRRRTGPTRS
jgi:hypothetical protein